MRELYALDLWRGYPGTKIRVGDSAGSLLFVELRTEPVVQVAALDRDDVAELVTVLGEWLREGLPSQVAPSMLRPSGVGGRIARGLTDARTVQNRTVRGAVRGADQHEPPGAPASPV
jgi:hypothetical protein